MLSPAVLCFLMLFLLYYGRYSCFTYLFLYRARACCRLLSYAFLALLQPVPMLYLCICFSCFTTGFTYALLLCIGRACCRLLSYAFLALLQPVPMLYLCICFSCFTTGFTYALLLCMGRACCRLLSCCRLLFSAAPLVRAALDSPYALCLMPYA
jgi:hypothetical protein